MWQGMKNHPIWKWCRGFCPVHSGDGGVMKCFQCEGEILKPKPDQKFCNKLCRYAFHNRLKKRAFAQELMALLKKYRVLDLEVLDEKEKHQGV
jgi:hypothetical protein